MTLSNSIAAVPAIGIAPSPDLTTASTLSPVLLLGGSNLFWSFMTLYHNDLHHQWRQ